MRSNSYSFPHVLSLYLLLFGAGSAVGSRVVRRADRPAPWFLGLQSAAGFAAICGVLVLTVLAPAIGLEGTLRSYFGGDGFNTGFTGIDSATEWAKLGFAYVAAPMLVMALPVFLFGASFPFVQALVSERGETLGRRTGTLLAANIAGNVAGTLLVGFVLLDRFGTATTTLALGAVLLVPGVVAAGATRDRPRRIVLAGAVVSVFLLVGVLFPSNAELWAVVHGVDAGEDFELVEDRSCVTTLKQGDLDDGYESFLFVNASGQNGYPWDDFHVLVGLTPALLHPDPEHGLAVGLGMGGTAYGMVQDPRLASVDTVELCGGQIELLRRMAAEGSPEHRRMFAEERLRLLVGDGRRYLLLAEPTFDVVTVDVLRPQSAFSGSILSVEFYELVRSRLTDDGLMAQWIASSRSGNSVARAFPYAIGFTVPSYHGSQFFVAGKRPIHWDRAEVLRRLDALGDAGAFRGEQLRALRTFYERVEPFCLTDGAVAGDLDGARVNRDLAPRDEYFLNNPEAEPGLARCRSSS
jgi:spermidine synthase